MTLRTPNYGNYGIFLIMGNAGFILSPVACPSREGKEMQGSTRKLTDSHGEVGYFESQGTQGYE